jgi:hypothetical protein
VTSPLHKRNLPILSQLIFLEMRTAGRATSLPPDFLRYTFVAAHFFAIPYLRRAL